MDRDGWTEIDGPGWEETGSERTGVKAQPGQGLSGEPLNAEGDGQPDQKHVHQEALNRVPSRNGLRPMQRGERQHDEIHDQVEANAEE